MVERVSSFSLCVLRLKSPHCSIAVESIAFLSKHRHIAHSNTAVVHLSGYARIHTYDACDSTIQCYKWYQSECGH